MSLANLQKAVARAVMQPLTRNEHMRVVGPGWRKNASLCRPLH